MTHFFYLRSSSLLQIDGQFKESFTWNLTKNEEKKKKKGENNVWLSSKNIKECDFRHNRPLGNVYRDRLQWK